MPRSAPSSTTPATISGPSRRGKRQSDPALTYDLNGKPLGIINILLPKPRPAPTPYNRLRMCVFEGDLFILPTEEQVPVDALPPGDAYEIDLTEASALPPWPARKFTSIW